MGLAAKSADPCSKGGDEGQCIEHLLQRVRTLQDAVLDHERLTGFALGLAVIGGMSLVMTMFAIVNMAHRTRRLVWHIIKETISIFAAVLLFSVLSNFVEQSIEEYGIWEFVNNSFYLCFYGALLAWVRAWALHPLHDKIDHHLKMSRSIRMMEVGLVAAHACGFALTEGWGQRLQVGGLAYGLWPMQFNTVRASLVLLVQVLIQYTIILAVLVWIRRCTTERRIREEHEDGEESKLLKKYVEVMTDGENDILGILGAFLVTMVVRQAITGQLPEKNGEDAEEVLHRVSIHDGLLLALVALIALLMSVLYEVKLMVPSRRKKEKVANFRPCWQTVMLYMLRMADIGRNITTMTCAWCWMYAHAWLLGAMRIGHGEQYIRALCLAISVSVEVWVVVLVIGIVGGKMAAARMEARKSLRKQVSQDSTEEEMNTIAIELKTQFRSWAAHDTIFRSLRALMEKIFGFLLGFTWESCFDNAVEGLTKYFQGGSGHIISPTILELLIGCMVVFLVLPVWGAIIVPMVTESGYRFGFVPRRKRDQSRQEGWEDDIVGAFQVLHEYNELYRERDEEEEDEEEEYGLEKVGSTSLYLFAKSRSPAKLRAVSAFRAAGAFGASGASAARRERRAQQEQKPEQQPEQHPLPLQASLPGSLSPSRSALRQQTATPQFGGRASAAALRDVRSIAMECAEEAEALQRLVDSLAAPLSKPLLAPPLPA